MLRFGWQAGSPDVDLMWLLDFLNDFAERKPNQRDVGPTYEDGFRHIWRQRFAHLHPDVIALAINAEWSQMKMNDTTGFYERTYPACWPGNPFYDTPAGHHAMRENR